MNQKPKLTDTINTKKLGYYLMPSVLCIAYALFIDVRFGVIFLTLYILLPLAAIMLYRPVLGKVTAEVTVSAAEMKKGDNVELTSYLNYKGSFGLCLVRIELFDPPAFSHSEGSGGEAVFVLSQNTAEKAVQTYRAELSGKSVLGIKRFEITDLFGLCSYSPGGEENWYSHDVHVLPDIPALGNNELLKESLNTTMREEDEESQTRSLPVSGLPGFEHREYVPGDSFKKINWKLSAKRDIFMVRMDEAVAWAKQVLILDPARADVIEEEGERPRLLKQQYMMEALLGFCSLLIRQHLETDIYYMNDGKWQKFTVKDEQDLSRMQYIMSAYAFSPAFERPVNGMFSELEKHGGNALIFSCAPGQELFAWARELERSGATPRIIKPEGTVTFGYEGDIWTVSPEYDFSHIV